MSFAMLSTIVVFTCFFFFQAEDGIRDRNVTGVQTCALPILERTHQLNTIVLDKTGTITKGKPEVTDFTGDEEVLQLLASAEKGSEHPLAEAIVAHAAEKNIDLLEVEDFAAIPGHGIRAVISNKNVLVGTRKLMNDNEIDIQEVEEQLVKFEIEGKTAMIIAIDGKYSGIIAVADTVKETAAEAI